MTAFIRPTRESSPRAAYRRRREIRQTQLRSQVTHHIRLAKRADWRGFKQLSVANGSHPTTSWLSRLMPDGRMGITRSGDVIVYDAEIQLQAITSDQDLTDDQIDAIVDWLKTLSY